MIKIQDLIAELTKFQEEYGNVEVWVYETGEDDICLPASGLIYGENVFRETAAYITFNYGKVIKAG